MSRSFRKPVSKYDDRIARDRKGKKEKRFNTGRTWERRDTEDDAIMGCMSFGDKNNRW